MTVLAIFRSRSQTLDFVTKLRFYGITAQTVNTPKEAGVGCGLSAKFPLSALARAKYILKNTRYSAFLGVFQWDTRFNGRLIRLQ